MSLDPCTELQAVLHRDVPLTREMGLHVLDWQGGRLRLGAPLEPNVNHKSTMFGGSLYSVAVLAGWGWLYLRLAEAGLDEGHVVIQDGQITYPLPVSGMAVAICEAPAEVEWQRFVRTYQRHGRARLVLQTQVRNQGSDEDAVRFTGQYVLHR